MRLIFRRDFVNGDISADIDSRNEADLVEESEISINCCRIRLVFQSVREALGREGLFRLQRSIKD